MLIARFMGCDAQTDHDYRMAKRAIKIRNEDRIRCQVKLSGIASNWRI